MSQRALENSGTTCLGVHIARFGFNVGILCAAALFCSLALTGCVEGYVPEEMTSFGCPPRGAYLGRKNQLEVLQYCARKGTCDAYRIAGREGANRADNWRIGIALSQAALAGVAAFLAALAGKTLRRTLGTPAGSATEASQKLETIQERKIDEAVGYIWASAMVAGVDSAFAPDKQKEEYKTIPVRANEILVNGSRKFDAFLAKWSEGNEMAALLDLRQANDVLAECSGLDGTLRWNIMSVNAATVRFQRVAERVCEQELAKEIGIRPEETYPLTSRRVDAGVSVEMIDSSILRESDAGAGDASAVLPQYRYDASPPESGPYSHFGDAGRGDSGASTNSYSCPIKVFEGLSEIKVSTEIRCEKIVFRAGAILRVRHGAALRLLADSIVAESNATIDGTGDPGDSGVPGGAPEEPWNSQGDRDYWAARGDCEKNPGHHDRGRSGGPGGSGGPGATIFFSRRPAGLLRVLVEGGAGGRGGAGGQGRLLRNGRNFYCDGCTYNCPSGAAGVDGHRGSDGSITIADA